MNTTAELRLLPPVRNWLAEFLRGLLVELDPPPTIYVELTHYHNGHQVVVLDVCWRGHAWGFGTHVPLDVECAAEFAGLWARRVVEQLVRIDRGLPLGEDHG